MLGLKYNLYGTSEVCVQVCLKVVRNWIVTEAQNGLVLMCRIVIFPEGQKQNDM